MRERLFRCRIDHVLTAAAVAAEPFAVDEKFEIGVHEKPRCAPLNLLLGPASGLRSDGGISRFCRSVHPARACGAFARLQRVSAGFAGANAQRMIDRRDEYLAVADFPGFRGGGERLPAVFFSS